jgi:hypothetical protein
MKASKIIALLALVAAFAYSDPRILAQSQSQYSGEPFVPSDGFVPNEATAVLIARAVLGPIYGSQIEYEKPYNGSLENGVWIIEGSLPPGAVGGVFTIWISKKDGTILRVSHES